MAGDYRAEAPRAYLSPPGEGRALPLLGVLKASGEQTRGAFEVIEYQGNAMQPPPHIHREREEAFYILNGKFRFTLGSELVEAGQGSWVFVPRGTRHGFTADPDARALILVVPAGLEGFFEELGAGLFAGKTSLEMRDALQGKYDSIPA
jgi:mannose-6-phosphate isomerase-like protein (cupin superfamily)